MTDKLINMIESADDSAKIAAAMKLKGATLERLSYELAAINHEEPFSKTYIKQIISGQQTNAKARDHKYNIMKYLGLVD